MTALPDSQQTAEHAEPDIGVLFVHGIGHQLGGETMVQFGDPLLIWLANWFEGAWRPEFERGVAAGKKFEEVTEDLNRLQTGQLTVSKAWIKPHDETPAHATVRIEVKQDEQWTWKKWLLAESCWGTAFVPPSFKALAFWGLVVYPWTNAAHFGSIMRRQWSRAWRHKTALRNLLATPKAALVVVILSVMSVLTSIIVLALLLLLLVLAIPPIPSVRAMLLRVQQVLADSLGDSFILTASPIQRAAIIEHVRRDLEWLLEQGCKKIAVLAHSQGAAVAFETLATGVLQRRGLKQTMLITFGSGIEKLRELQSPWLPYKLRNGWWPIVGLVMIALSLEFCNIINVLPSVRRDYLWGVCFGTIGLLFWLVGVAIAAGDPASAEEFDPAKKFKTQTIWRDYYASHDPVPNGPLHNHQRFIQSVEVHNRASLWRDHTTYWVNRDEFVPAVIGDLAELSDFPLLELRAGDATAVRTAAARRAMRVRWLARARLAIWLTSAFVVLSRWSDLPNWGTALLAQLPLLEKALGWVGVKDIAQGQIASSILARDVAGLALVAFCAVAAYEILFVTWKTWSWRDTRVLWRREDYASSDAYYWAFVVLGLLLVNVGIWISLRLPASDIRAIRVSSLSTYILAPGVSGFVVMFVIRLFRGKRLFSTFGDALIAALLLAPVMAVSATVQFSPDARAALVAVMLVVGCILVHYCGVAIASEQEKWKRVAI